MNRTVPDAPPKRSFVAALRGCLRAFLGGLCYSLLASLSLPPVSWWWLSFAAPAGLIVAAMAPGARVRRDTLAAFAGIVPFWAINAAWMFPVTELGYGPAVALQSSYGALFVGLVILVRRAFTRGTARGGLSMSLLAPIMWVALEYLRGEHVFAGYAWALIGQPLIDAPMLAALGAMLGSYAVSLLTVAPAAIIADVVKDGRRWAPVCGATVVVASVIVANILTSGPSGPALGERSVRLAVVQTNVPQSNKTLWTPEREVEDWREMVELAIDASGRSTSKPAPAPDLIVWPETMIPGISIEPQVLQTLKDKAIYWTVEIDGAKVRLDAGIFAEELFELSRRLEIPMIVGEEARIGFSANSGPSGQVVFAQDQRFNSVYLIDRGAIAGPRYDKIRLTPFGETIPGISRWKWLEGIFLDFGARGLKFDLSAGTRPTRLEVPMASGEGTVRVVAPVCFEIIVSDLCRELVYDGAERKADLIANVTNDGWFTFSDATRLQHLQIARWRSLETATPMIRAANTGASALIDARGRLISTAPTREAFVLAGSLNLHSGVSVFAKVASVVGNIAGWGPMVAAATLIAIGLYRLRFRRGS